MEVNNNVAAIQAYSNMGTNKTSNISVNDFLKIMAAELQNQSPMGGDSGGGSKTDYLSQLAQITMLEQMNTVTEGINQNNMLNQVSLIGKSVKIYAGKENVIGEVERVKFYNSSVILQVNGEDYPINLLMEVSDKPIIEKPDTPSDEVIE